MTEYIVICVALILALGIGMVDEQSVLRQLINAFVQGYRNVSFAISLP